MRTNYADSKLDLMEEKDKKKLRKPKFETYPNGTVKF